MPIWIIHEQIINRYTCLLYIQRTIYLCHGGVIPVFWDNCNSEKQTGSFTRKFMTSELLLSKSLIIKALGALVQF